MTTFKVPGVHKKTAKGRVYYYHAASGARITASPDDLRAFLAEVAALDALPAPPAPKPQREKTLGWLITEYKKSPEWHRLSPDTHKAYQQAFNVLQPLDALPVEHLEQPNVLRFRDRVYNARGRWMANTVVAVLSVVLGWGVPRGHCTRNAASGVPKIRRSRSAGVANKAWTHDEVLAAIRAAYSSGVRKGIALAYYTGLRLKDVVELPAAARASGEIMVNSSKPGIPLSVFEAKALTAILDEPDRHTGPTLVRTLQGRPYTRSGFSAIFKRMVKRLAEAGKVRPGLTFHGLRKSLGRDAAAVGMSEDDISRALGQTSPASARPYTVEYQQREAARKVMRALEKEGKR